MSSDDPAFRVSKGYVGWCEACQKRSFINRKAARAAGRKTGSGPMSAYRCPATPEGATPLWHTGHVASVVRRGELGKDEWLEGRR